MLKLSEKISCARSTVLLTENLSFDSSQNGRVVCRNVVAQSRSEKRCAHPPKRWRTSKRATTGRGLTPFVVQTQSLRDCAQLREQWQSSPCPEGMPSARASLYNEASIKECDKLALVAFLGLRLPRPVIRKQRFFLIRRFAACQVIWRPSKQ